MSNSFSIPHLRESHYLSVLLQRARTFGLWVVATVTRHIFSHHNTERDNLLLDTGQIRGSTPSSHGRVRGRIGVSSGGEGGQDVGGDDGEEEKADPLLVELSNAPAMFNPPLKFLKSVFSYVNVNDYITGASLSHSGGTRQRVGTRVRISVGIEI